MYTICITNLEYKYQLGLYSANLCNLFSLASVPQDRNRCQRHWTCLYETKLKYEYEGLKLKIFTITILINRINHKLPFLCNLLTGAAQLITNRGKRRKVQERKLLRGYSNCFYVVTLSFTFVLDCDVSDIITVSYGVVIAHCAYHLILIGAIYLSESI